MYYKIMNTPRSLRYWEKTTASVSERGEKGAYVVLTYSQSKERRRTRRRRTIYLCACICVCVCVCV